MILLNDLQFGSDLLTVAMSNQAKLQENHDGRIGKRIAAAVRRHRRY